MHKIAIARLVAATSLIALAASGCATGGGNLPELPPASFVTDDVTPTDEYIIGPLDELTINVWRNDEVGGRVNVRPDGRISMPLITELMATGKTPTQLAEDITLRLSEYINEPLVSVVVNNFSGTFSQQVRIVGATEKPASIPYRANMTLLDAMISVGGLSEFASGNKARLIRADRDRGAQKEYALRIDDLLKRGDSRANVRLQPGDVIIIPESFF